MPFDLLEHRRDENGSDMALILDHFRQPRHYGLMELADVDRESLNPGCGDRVRVQARIGSDGVLEDVRFVGNGCVISMTESPLTTEIVPASVSCRTPSSLEVESVGDARAMTVRGAR